MGRRRRAPRSLSEPVLSPVKVLWGVHTLHQSNPGGASFAFVRRRCCVRRFGSTSMKVFCRTLAGPLK